MRMSETFRAIARWFGTWLLRFGPWHAYLATLKDHDVVVAIQCKSTCHSSGTAANDSDAKP